MIPRFVQVSTLRAPLLVVPVALALLGGCHRSAAPAAAATAAAASLGSPSATCTAPVPAAAAVSLANTPVAAPLVVFDTAWAIIARTHWDTTYNGVNWRAVRDELRPRAAAAKTTGELRTVLSDMVSRLKQSHFSIIPREVSDATTGASASSSSGSSSGSSKPAEAGGSVGMTLRYVDGAVLVTAVDPDGGAARAGVGAGWILEAVNGCPLAPRLARIPKDTESRRAALLAYSAATSALAGPIGDSARVTLRDGNGRLRNVAIPRMAERGTTAKFGNLPPFHADLDFEKVRQGNRTVGVIRFNIWMPVLGAQFDAAIDSLRDADAIVLDIRGNFGGVGGMAMGFAGHFLDTTLTIGTMHQRGQGAMKFVANPRRVDTRARRVTPFAGPVALVVDELSISTSEIFAGGMQELKRARVFGTQTAGQALPAVSERLPNGDILYHAIANFTSPSGRDIEGDGVIPDVAAPVTRKALLAGKDPARDAAIAWAAAAAKPAAKVTP